MEPLAEQNKCIDKAQQTLEYMSQDPEERQRAWAREKFLWDQEVRESRAREEGKEEGREEGRLEGERKGRIESAKLLLKTGMDIEEVCRIIGLSKDDLR